MVALCGLLLYRLAPDVGGKPLYEDEAVAGLIAMRPLGEVVETVLVDRGGAPLHFVLAHAVFWIDTSAEALRWLSVVCATAAVPLCFDLGRRLGGSVAGIVAAAVVASSTALAVYGSFGRMYALYVLVAALAADLFVRAVHLRSRSAVIAAAAAAWLLPAVHPYGAIPALAELVVAAILWRRRSIRDALPVAIAAVAAVPFFLADLRLADRAEVGAGGGEALGTMGDAWSELLATLSAFAGGDGLPLVSFTALALVGLAVAARREPAFFAVAVTVAAPPVLFLLLRAESAPDLSPRHLFFGLPLWAAAIGMGADWLRRWLPRPAWQILVAAIVLLAISAPPSALRDPRELGLTPSGVDGSVQAGPDDILFPYSIAFLARLGDVRQALALPQEPSAAILAALEHGEPEIGTVFVAIPRERWTIVAREGPFDKSGALLAAAEEVARSDHPPKLDWWYELVERDLCDALAELGSRCPA